ncbi:uncharacterized protein LOC112590437 [Harpegnathos saltator]|uniref:uncharacterized protein LOC112590437 n=1 Tax=Harpegnathos saltator TaxID=610380 RepID=UPI000DBEEBB3|nr:uncharacterized protein LOC112590437 [Harpegnathos saltator]
MEDASGSCGVREALGLPYGIAGGRSLLHSPTPITISAVSHSNHQNYGSQPVAGMICYRRHPLNYTGITEYADYILRDMFLNYEQTRLQPHAILNSTFRRSSEDKAESTEAQNVNVMDAILTEGTTVEIDTIDSLGKVLYQV